VTLLPNEGQTVDTVPQNTLVLILHNFASHISLATKKDVTATTTTSDNKQCSNNNKKSSNNNNNNNNSRKQ